MNVDTTYSVLSLCSGIGGLDLGVCRTFGARVLGYVERDSHAATVLMERMESADLEPAPVWIGDLRDLDARPLAGVDVVCAGYPCQPFSQAGKRLGEEDERHLWPEVARVIREVRPKYVCLENVAGHLRLGFDRVLGDLHDLGFDAEWACLRAADVGAPHLRRRLFILATRRGVPDPRGGSLRFERQCRGRQHPECGTPEPRADGSQGDVAHPHSGGLEVLGITEPAGLERQPRDEPDGCNEVSSWTAEPDVGRVAHGIPFRVDRLRCLGNAVVPQQAEYAFSQLLRRTR